MMLRTTRLLRVAHAPQRCTAALNQKADRRLARSSKTVRRSSAANAAAPAVDAAAFRLAQQVHLTLYDTLDRQRKPFIPDDTRPVSMYVCGVTVYDFSHVGHARVYVAFDVLVRVLQHLGLEVKYVRNFTDIDDKIIARAAEIGEDPLALSRRFIDEFHKDMDVLGCLRPQLEPKATEFIQDMVKSIEVIIENGHAYPVEGGDVLFDVQSLGGYGKLSKQDVSQSKAGAGNRVAVDTRKKHPADFALWKSAKEGEPSWDSPWGAGRPGWHIECSAMIHKLLGKVVDIHGGGQDLVFPHHENELAQSRASCCSPTEEEDRLARFWMHNGFVNIDNEKMSKSLGNFFTIRDVLKRYHGMAMRWFLVGTQYRQPINYSQVALEEASARLYYILETILSARKMIAESGEEDVIEKAVEALQSGEAVTSEVWADVRGAFLDDLNTPAAIAFLSEPLKTMNELLIVRKKKKVENRIEKLAQHVALVEQTLSILGIALQQPAALLQELRALALVRAELTEEDIEAAITERAAARKAKDFARADELRDEFASKGINFQDSPEGTTWRPATQV